MGDERLTYIVENWNEFSWFDRKLIWLRCIKHKHGITGKKVISLATLISILVVLIWENHPQHMTGLLAIIVLSFIHIIFIDYLLNRGKLI